MAITYAFLSGNAKKSAEYREQLAKYGRSICILPFDDDEGKRRETIEAYLAKADEKDGFVFRETSELYVADDWDAGTRTISSKSVQGERVYNASFLTVYSFDRDRKLQTKNYEAQVEGYVDLTLREGEASPDGWWDDIFVADRSKTSYRMERDLWGKTSARQQVIGLFICDNLLFKKLRDVNFNPHEPKQAVEFTPERSAVVLIRNNPFFKMARLEQCPWGLGNLLTNAINAGIFFRSADSRRSGNYFCPPLSGIPRTKKPDPFWESTFLIHDVFHQPIPDQSFTGVTSQAHEFVFSAARLMSEGFTIILADMLFVEAAKAAGFEYDYSTRKINPLFGSLVLPGDTQLAKLKALLKANVCFANLGDEKPYRAMLKPGSEGALASYTETYKHFFVPDLLWSVDNYRDMVTRGKDFKAWVRLVGRDMFARANLPLLDDTVKTLRADGADFSSYESVVPAVFEHIFERVIAPKLTPVTLVSDEEAQSNAFRRYMIGQCFLYAHYRNVAGMKERGLRMLRLLRAKDLYTQDDIDRLRRVYKEDLLFLHKSGTGVLTSDVVALYEQIYPIFSPSFLSYDFDNTPYDSVTEAIAATWPRREGGTA